MIPGLTKVLECPNCKSLYTKATYASGNTIVGARTWTDGQSHAPMWPRAHGITKCEKCDNIFWVKDAKEIGKFSFTNKDLSFTDKNIPQKWRGLKPISNLEIDDLVKAVKEKAHEVKDEIYLRKLLWWKINDPIRQGKEQSISEKRLEIFKDNLQMLKSILGNTNENRIMKAEIYRELGNFDNVSKLLSDLPKKYDTVFEKIQSLAKQKNSLVSEYSLDDPHAKQRDYMLSQVNNTSKQKT